MKLPDVNVLIHAVDTTHPNHAVARSWLQSALADTGGVGFAWLVLVGFVRVSTRAGILTQPLSVPDALGIMDDWLGHAGARVVHPGERHAPGINVKHRCDGHQYVLLGHRHTVDVTEHERMQH